MNGVAVIGTSMIDLVVIGRQVFEMEHCNKAQIVRSFGGSMHNVAYNCGCLGLETHFVSKFGRDDAGLAIVNELQKKTCFVYGPVVNQSTPVFISASDSEKGLYFSSIQPEFLFHGEREDLPYCVLSECTWGITDQTDPVFLTTLLAKTPQTHWIFSGQIPPETTLDKWEGIVLNRDEMTAYAGSVPMAQAAKTLLKKGVSWIIITLDKDGALLITLDGIRPYPCLLYTSIEDIASAKIGSEVTIVGGNLQAVDAAQYLIAQGKHVTLVSSESKDKLDKGQSAWVKTFTIPMLYARGTRLWPNAQVTRVNEGTITIHGETGVEMEIPCDTVIEALDMLPNSSLIEGLDGIECYAVGDCDKPWNIAEAIASGNLTARKI